MVEKILVESSVNELSTFKNEDSGWGPNTQELFKLHLKVGDKFFTYWYNVSIRGEDWDYSGFKKTKSEAVENIRDRAEEGLLTASHLFEYEVVQASEKEIVAKLLNELYDDEIKVAKKVKQPATSFKSRVERWKKEHQTKMGASGMNNYRMAVKVALEQMKFTPPASLDQEPGYETGGFDIMKQLVKKQHKHMDVKDENPPQES